MIVIRFTSLGAHSSARIIQNRVGDLQTAQKIRSAICKWTWGAETKNHQCAFLKKFISTD